MEDGYADTRVNVSVLFFFLCYLPECVCVCEVTRRQFYLTAVSSAAKRKSKRARERAKGRGAF